MDDLKATFCSPPQEIQLPRTLIHNCPAVKFRKDVLRQVNKKIKLFETEINEVKKNTAKFVSPPKTTDVS